MYLHAIKFKGWHVDCIMCLLNMGVDKVVLLFLATFHKPRTLFSDVRYKELHVLTNMVIIIALFELYLSCVRFQVLTAASMMFKAVFWVILPCKMIVD
jgi:hypothetical protein